MVHFQAEAGDEQSICQPDQSNRVATALDASESGPPYLDDRRPKSHSVAATATIRVEPIDQSAAEIVTHELSFVAGTKYDLSIHWHRDRYGSEVATCLCPKLAECSLTSELAVG